MKEEKKDLRIIKTRSRLYETLLILLKEKSFEEIKVSDICEKALINRSTFYAHFSDKYELLASFIADLKSALTLELEKNKKISNTKEYYLEMIKLLLDHIDSQRDIYPAILVNNKNSIITDMVYNALNEAVTKHLEKEPITNRSNIPVNIIAKFYIGATFNVGVEWLQSNKKYTKQQILDFLEKLIPDNIG